MSARGTPLTRMPAEFTSTSDLMRSVVRIAISSATQPPMHWPTTCDAVEAERVEQIEIEEREVAGVVDQLGLLGEAEARMVRRDHVEVLRERRKPRLGG